MWPNFRAAMRGDRHRKPPQPFFRLLSIQVAIFSETTGDIALTCISGAYVASQRLQSNRHLILATSRSFYIELFAINEQENRNIRMSSNDGGSNSGESFSQHFQTRKSSQPTPSPASQPETHNLNPHRSTGKTNRSTQRHKPLRNPSSTTDRPMPGWNRPPSRRSQGCVGEHSCLRSTDLYRGAFHQPNNILLVLSVFEHND